MDFCADFNRNHEIAPDVDLDYIEFLLIGSLDAGLMAQNALTAAESMGLGDVYIGGVRLNITELTEVLHLPKYVVPCRARRAGAVHPATELYARSDDESKRFQVPNVRYWLLLILSCILIMMSSMIILPMFLQTGAGLMLLPGSALNGILSPRMGHLFDKYGPKWLVIPGLVIVSVMLWFFTILSPASSVAFIVALHIGLMVGVGMIWMPAQTNGLNQLPPELYPHGTAVMNTLQQVVGAIGTAVAISILTGGMEKYLHGSSAPAKQAEMTNAMTAGSQNVFLFAMIIALMGLVIAFFIRREAVHSLH